METLRAFLSGCMASLSFSSPKGSAEALPEVFSPLQNLPAPSHTANICRIRRLPTLTERLCEIAGRKSRGGDLEETKLVGCDELSRELNFRRVTKKGARKMSEPSKEELLARIAELEKQAGSRKKGSLEFRVGEKGGVSVYGLGRFPVTLYYEQWIRLLDVGTELRAFLEENKRKLKLKTAE